MIFGKEYATWEEEIEGLKPQQIQMYAWAWKYAELGRCPGCYELMELWESYISPNIRLKDVSIVVERLFWHGYFNRNGYYGLDINDHIPGGRKG